MNKKIYQHIATAITALQNIHNRPYMGNDELVTQAWEDYLDEAMQGAPSGSGIDCGTKLLQEKCKEDLIVFEVEYHHMDEHGFYNGWTGHEVRVKPHFQFDYTIRISGPNRNDIKEYLGEVYTQWLCEEKDISYKFHKPSS